MAASSDEGNKENVANGEAEQIVTMEKVVAADNKGIDYDKLISKCSLPFLFIVLSLIMLLNAQGKVLNLRKQFHRCSRRRSLINR